MNEDEQKLLVWGLPLSFEQFIGGFNNPQATLTIIDLNEQAARERYIQQLLDRQKNSEIVRVHTPEGETSTSPLVIGMSGTDPIGLFAVETAVLGKPFVWAGKGALYGLARFGSGRTLNWARAKLFSGLLNSSIPESETSGVVPYLILNFKPAQVHEPKTALRFFERPLNKGFEGRFNKSIPVELTWTPEQWTAAQDAAIARGDMAEAQRLRDLHFKVSAPNTKVKEVVFNGSTSDKPFYEFNTNFRNAHWGGRDDYTTGAWFGVGDEKTMLSFAEDNPNRLRKFYLNFSNPFIKDAGYRRWNNLLPFDMTEKDIAIEAAKLREKGFPEYVIEDWKKGLGTTTDNYALKLETTDYDSGIIKNVYENKAHPDSDYGVITDYIASKPNQIKLADAITYDENGVRIPLGKRDNFNLKDIRYMWPTALLGGTAAASYANQQGLGVRSVNKFYLGGNIIKRFKNRNK